MINMNSKWIYLNLNHKVIKPLEDNLGENLDNVGFGDYFLDTIIPVHERNNG